MSKRKILNTRKPVLEISSKYLIVVSIGIEHFAKHFSFDIRNYSICVYFLNDNDDNNFKIRFTPDLTEDEQPMVHGTRSKLGIRTFFTVNLKERSAQGPFFNR
jgi:hypothetical protein